MGVFVRGCGCVWSQLAVSVLLFQMFLLSTMAVVLQALCVPGRTYYIPIEQLPKQETTEDHTGLLYRILPPDPENPGQPSQQSQHGQVLYIQEKEPPQPVVNKRSSGCLGRCLRMRMLHPAQCNTLC